MATLRFFLLLVLGLHEFSVGLRVLIVAPNVSFSHLSFAGRFADLLVEAGHQVDILIPEWNRFVRGNGTEKARVRRVALRNVDELEAALKGMAMLNDVFRAEITGQTRIEYGRIDSIYCEGILADRHLLAELRAAKYAAGMVEYFDPCSLALLRHVGIRSTHVLSIVPLDEQTAVANGEPVDFAHVPTILNVHQHTPVGSLWERAFNFLTWLQLHFHTLPRQFATVDTVTRRLLGPDFPSTAQLLREVDFFWLNSNQFVDAPRPLSARFKHVGGIAVRPPGQLSSDIEELMCEKEGNEGVILVSFGSIVRTGEMPPEVRKSFVRAFAALPQFTFIWKLSAPAAFRRSLSPNVHVVEWMNQTAILAHPRTRLFLTHGGCNSLNEAAMFGVPLVGIPFYSDQHVNIAAAVRRHFSRSLDRRRLTADGLVEAIRAVAYNPQYRESAARIRRLIAAAPERPAEIFVQHVEFAAKAGGVAAALRLPAAADQTTVSRFHLDLLLLFFVLLMFCGVFVRLFLQSVIRYSPIVLEYSKRVQKKVE